MGIFSYLMTMLVAMFWIFRVVVAFTYSMGINFIAVPMNLTIEIIVLFVTLFSFIFIIKRNAIGTLIYFVTYGLYFGTYIYESIKYGKGYQFDLIISIIAIIISSLTLIDILLNKNRKSLLRNKESDWFYKNEQFDRKYDDRADKNQYKF